MCEWKAGSAFTKWRKSSSKSRTSYFRIPQKPWKRKEISCFNILQKLFPEAGQLPMHMHFWYAFLEPLKIDAFFICNKYALFPKFLEHALWATETHKSMNKSRLWWKSSCRKKTRGLSCMLHAASYCPTNHFNFNCVKHETWVASQSSMPFSYPITAWNVAMSAFKSGSVKTWRWTGVLLMCPLQIESNRVKLRNGKHTIELCMPPQKSKHQDCI